MVKKKMGYEKRAVSPVIATVLLILIVVIIAIIILIWYFAFMGEQVMKNIDDNNKDIKLWCTQVELTPIANPDGSITVRNNGNVPLYGYKLVLKQGGKSDTETNKGKEYAINEGGGKVVVEDNTYEEVYLFPILLGKSKSNNVMDYTCSDNPIKLA